MDGLVGSITSRNEAHAVRLATLYAILDCSSFIRNEHLRAALAVVDYSTRSVIHIFGDKVGNRTADEILDVLKKAGVSGKTRTELFEHFQKNKPGPEIKRALITLESRGVVHKK